jgi:hypothetical protein
MPLHKADNQVMWNVVKQSNTHGCVNQRCRHSSTASSAERPGRYPYELTWNASPDDPSPSLHPHYQASPLLRDGPPLHPASLRSPSRIQPLEVLAPGHQPQDITAPLASRPIGTQVHTFRTRAQTTLAPPPRRTPPGQSTGTRQAHPRAAKIPWFRCHPIPFDASSVVRFRSPS